MVFLQRRIVKKGLEHLFITSSSSRFFNKSGFEQYLFKVSFYFELIFISYFFHFHVIYQKGELDKLTKLMTLEKIRWIAKSRQSQLYSNFFNLNLSESFFSYLNKPCQRAYTPYRRLEWFAWFFIIICNGRAQMNKVLTKTKAKVDFWLFAIWGHSIIIYQIWIKNSNCWNFTFVYFGV